jgi:L-iditol 2-dehydrogenase
MTGEIVGVGGGVSEYKVGDRVFVSHHVPCGSCRYCLSGHETACETLHKTNYDPGGFAEYVRIPKLNVERGVYLLPPGLSYVDGTLVEPLACVVRGQRLASVGAGQTVLVLGSGVSGLLHIKLAKAFGVSRIIATDISEYRLKKAVEFGADAVIDAREDVPKKLLELNDGRLADRVIVSSGVESAARQALACVDRGGVVLYFAVPKPGFDLPVPINDFWRNEVTVLTSYGASPKDLSQALNLITRRRVCVSDMITHRLGLSEAGRGFRLVADAGESLKVVIEPQR